MKKFFAFALAGAMVLSCATAAFAEEATTEEAAATTTDGEAGFDEYPIGEEQDIDFFHISAVYFQPVDLEPAGQALAKEDSNLHIEADISALENDLGYGVGDWIPYLTMDYKVVDADGNVVDNCEGSFMPMSASDGPHYGANINLTTAGTYSLVLTIHSPAENGYLLHVDPETGVAGNFDEYSFPYEVTFSDWEYTPQEW